jgi:hypothetical protein
LKLPPADDAAGNFHERFVDEGELFESNARAHEVIEPGGCAFNDSSGFTKATAMRFTPTGDRAGVPVRGGIGGGLAVRRRVVVGYDRDSG